MQVVTRLEKESSFLIAWMGFARVEQTNKKE